jgi:hypothetical protein
LIGRLFVIDTVEQMGQGGSVAWVGSLHVRIIGLEKPFVLGKLACGPDPQTTRNRWFSWVWLD